MAGRSSTLGAVWGYRGDCLEIAQSLPSGCESDRRSRVVSLAYTGLVPAIVLNEIAGEGLHRPATGYFSELEQCARLVETLGLRSCSFDSVRFIRQ